MPKILLETENSHLSISNFSKYEDLVEECVEYVTPLLLQEPEIIVFGKVCHQHRNIGFFSDDSIGYKYSNKLMESQPLNKILKKLIKKVNKKYETEYNSILVNFYENGTHYIGAHSDDEKGLDPEGVVLISYGAVRKFRIRDKKTKKIEIDVPLKHMYSLQMAGDFQK